MNIIADVLDWWLAVEEAGHLQYSSRVNDLPLLALQRFVAPPPTG